MKDFFVYNDQFLSTKKWYSLLKWFVPLSCMICKETDISKEGPFCNECLQKFKELFSKPCTFCGESPYNCQCFKTNGIKDLFFLFWYDGLLSADIIAIIKYRGERRYASYFGKLIAERIKEKSPNIKLDGVCFVPRSPNNIRKRGFDQSKLLAESVSYYLGVPLLPCIIRKGKSSEQKKLSGEERRKNVKNKFRVKIENLVFESGEIPSKILLIDDIITTGSTVKECSYLLGKSGVRNVYVGAIAKTPAKRPRKKRYRRKTA